MGGNIAPVVTIHENNTRARRCLLVAVNYVPENVKQSEIKHQAVEFRILQLMSINL